MGLEDLTSSKSDFNYNDDTFIFTGVTAVTPETSSFFLLGTGLMSLSIHNRLRRRFASERATSSDWSCSVRQRLSIAADRLVLLDAFRRELILKMDFKKRSLLLPWEATELKTRRLQGSLFLP